MLAVAGSAEGAWVLWHSGMGTRPAIGPEGMGRPEDSMDSLKQERDQALVDISNAARFLSNARQRELNGWLRELVQKIGKLREEDERGKPGRWPA